MAAEPPFHTPHSTKQPGTPRRKASRHKSHKTRPRRDCVMVNGAAVNRACARAGEGKPWAAHRQDFTCNRRLMLGRCFNLMLSFDPGSRQNYFVPARENALELAGRCGNPATFK